MFAFEYGLLLLLLGVCIGGSLIAALRRSDRILLSKRRIVLMSLSAVVLALWGVYFLDVEMVGDREVAHSMQCRNNIRLLSLALLQYAQDWHDTMPPANRWMDVIDTPKYLPNANRAALFHCPSARIPYGYAMNQSLSGMGLEKIREPTVLLFETDAVQRNAYGAVGSLAKTRHFSLNCSFCDGHTPEWINPSVTSRWRWSP